ncbi:MAG: hypothetical protein ACPHID_05665 [Thermoplasmatota archaeon]
MLEMMGFLLVMVATLFAGISVWVAVNQDGIGWRLPAGLAVVGYLLSWLVAWRGRPRDPNS